MGELWHSLNRRIVQEYIGPGNRGRRTLVKRHPKNTSRRGAILKRTGQIRMPALIRYTPGGERNSCLTRRS